MIFFDLDGTLLDSNGVWLEVDNTFLGRRGLAPTPEYTFTVGHSIFPVAAQFTKDYYHLEDDPEDIMAEWRSLARDAYAHTVPLKRGAKELLDRLRSQGWPIALLTASLPDLCRAALDRHGLTGYFQGFFFAQEEGVEKRNSKAYLLAAERFGVYPEDCVLFEDSPHNCAAAQAAGFDVIGVYDEFYKDQWDEVQANSRRAIRSLYDLLTEPFLLFP